jgi:hypothetical protein
VSAPEIYKKLTLLLDYWTVVSKKENGDPFEADWDIHMASLDIIMAIAFDFPQSKTTVSRQMRNTRVRPHEELQACIYLTQSIGVPFQSFVPRIAHWLFLQRPESRKAIRSKNQLIRRNINKAVSRLQSNEKPICAVDHLISREIENAAKLGVPTNFHRSEIYDEVSP